MNEYMHLYIFIHVHAYVCVFMYVNRNIYVQTCLHLYFYICLYTESCKFTQTAPVNCKVNFGFYSYIFVTLFPDVRTLVLTVLYVPRLLSPTPV